MSATVAIPAPPLFDETRLAIAGFLARYSGPTRTAYTTDLARRMLANSSTARSGSFIEKEVISPPTVRLCQPPS